jgi:hypothetical protein
MEIPGVADKGTKEKPRLRVVRDTSYSGVKHSNRWNQAVEDRALSPKIAKQIAKAGLPATGSVSFIPQLDKNKGGDPIIRRGTIQHGPKAGKKGYVDTMGRIWIKCRAHGSYPDHWDVQLDGGLDYFRVDLDGNILA